MKALDRRIIYLFVALSLAIPLAMKLSVKPKRMAAADKMFEIIEGSKFKRGEIALVAFDFGPNSMAENLPQAQIVVEHLLRKHIPFALYSQYNQAEGFLESIPQEVAAKLMASYPGEKWSYGRDWVNLGYRGGVTSSNIQALSESENLVAYFNRDARGNNLADIPAFQLVRHLEDIKLFIQFTSLTGTFESYLQFLKKANYRPIFLHGCTSITIPKAYIYLDSGQLSGLLEGVSGAAWYTTLIQEQYGSAQSLGALLINTGLGVAQLVLIFIIILGNIGEMFIGRKRRVAA